MSATKTLSNFQRAVGLSMKIARLSLFCGVVGVVLMVFLVRAVYASAATSVYELNHEWSRQAHSLDQQSYRVRLNGQAIDVSSHMVDQTVTEVLDAADEECRAHSAGLDTDIARLPGAAAAKLTSAVFGVVHRQWADHGYVACMERDESRGVSGIAADMREVVKTGDITKLGTLRYVMADRTAGSSKTHVLRHWTEAGFNVGAMFSDTGDAPGSDLPQVPRPEGSRRLLDASVEGSTFGVRVYDAPGTPEAILAGYERDLVARGWTRVEVPASSAGKMRVFDHGSSDLFITASRDGASTVVSIADMPPTR